MLPAKQAPKRKRRRKAVPLGVAGLSLSLMSGAPAAISELELDMPSRNNGLNHEVILGEGKSPTSAWRHSTYSTRKSRDSRAQNLPWGLAAPAGQASTTERRRSGATLFLRVIRSSLCVNPRTGWGEEARRARKPPAQARNYRSANAVAPAVEHPLTPIKLRQRRRLLRRRHAALPGADCALCRP